MNLPASQFNWIISPLKLPSLHPVRPALKLLYYTNERSVPQEVITLCRSKFLRRWTTLCDPALGGGGR